MDLVEENRCLRDQLATLSKLHAKKVQKLSNMIDERDRTLRKISQIMQGPANNRRFMQIAGPARECINLTKKFVEPPPPAPAPSEPHNP